MFISELVLGVILVLVSSARSGNGAVTDEQLREVSQSLWQADTKNANGAFRLVKQGRTSFGSIQDNAPSKLFEGTTASLWSSSPSISALKTLYDNYEPLVTRPETLTEGEKTEENNFLNAVLNTEVMREAKRFLTSNRLVSVANDAAFRQLLHKLWFGLYSRHRGTPSSSGFEHVFLGEVKQGQVTGFHNWLYFLDQEAKNNVNYLGWLKALSLGRGASDLFKVSFLWNNVNKDASSMFVGVSPEFEVALYTVCYYARPNKRCPMRVNGKTFDVKTFQQLDSAKNETYLGSAFAQF